MKKILLIGLLALLCGCGNSSNTTQTGTIATTTNGNSNTQTTSTDVANTVFEYEFVGCFGNEMDMFTQGWFFGNCIFEDDYLKLNRDEGSVRTPAFENNKDILTLELVGHISGMNNFNETALNKKVVIDFETLDVDKQTIDKKTYTHTVTAEDIQNQYFSDFPKYSSDFSEEPYKVELNATDAKHVRVTLVEKISFTVNGETTGCNLAINKLKVY